MSDQYCGGVFYLTDEGVVLATYDEAVAVQDPTEPSKGWYSPYGDLQLAMTPEQYRDDGTVSVLNPDGSNGTKYTRVAIDVGVLEQNSLSLPPPYPKDPPAFAGWAPYGSEAEFHHQVKKFSPASPMATVVRAIVAEKAPGGKLNQAFDELDAASAASGTEQEDVHRRNARAILMQESVEGAALHESLENALPAQLCVPQRAEDEMGNLSDRDVWRFRLLYCLVRGVQQGGLA